MWLPSGMSHRTPTADPTHRPGNGFRACDRGRLDLFVLIPALACGWRIKTIRFAPRRARTSTRNWWVPITRIERQRGRRGCHSRKHPTQCDRSRCRRPHRRIRKISGPQIDDRVTLPALRRITLGQIRRPTQRRLRQRQLGVCMLRQHSWVRRRWRRWWCSSSTRSKGVGDRPVTEVVEHNPGRGIMPFPARIPSRGSRIQHPPGALTGYLTGITRRRPCGGSNLGCSTGGNRSRTIISSRGINRCNSRTATRRARFTCV